MSRLDVDVDPIRLRLLTRASLLSYFSVAWGLIAGTWAVSAGLLSGSLGVLGLGLNVLADVAGSIGLVWRFRVERQDPEGGLRAEALASVVVASALILVAITLTIAAVNDLIAHAPLGWAKYRTGKSLGSHALMGDGTLSAMGAALGVLALLGLLADQFFGWWWADRVAALAVAIVASTEAIRVLRTRPD
jgi:divalent metal cation (Fe/Co/Zn/Cd) transporter